MKKHHLIFWIQGCRALPLLLSLLSLGCDGGAKGEVSGRVTYAGKPLPTGTVTFLDAKNEPVGSSAISAGRYSIARVPAGPVKILVSVPFIGASAPVRRRQPFKEKSTQPLIGKYKDASLPESPPITPVAIPAKFGNPHQSDLTYAVKPGQQDFDIELK